MGLKVTNNAFGTLNASINSSATTIVLVAGQGARFPTLSAGDYFYATLIDTSNNLEIVKCTARSTDTLTVVRAQDSTTARAYATNDRFELRPTAALFNEKANAADVAATYVELAGDTMTGTLSIDNASDAGEKALILRRGTKASTLVQSGMLHYKLNGIATAEAWEMITDRGLVINNLSGTNHLEIDNGILKLPLNPRAFVSYDGSRVTGLSGNTVIPMSNARINIGGHYNTSNYRFTCPKAGTYRVTAGMNTDNSAGYSILFYLFKNGANAGILSQGQTQSSNAVIFTSMNQLMECATGDYLQVITGGNFYEGNAHATFEYLG
jgi:hypothetical protein